MKKLKLMLITMFVVILAFIGNMYINQRNISEGLRFVYEVEFNNPKINPTYKYEKYFFTQIQNQANTDKENLEIQPKIYFNDGFELLLETIKIEKLGANEDFDFIQEIDDQTKSLFSEHMKENEGFKISFDVK